MSNNNSPTKMSTYKLSRSGKQQIFFNKTSHRQVKIFKKHHILSLPHNNTMSCTSN